MKIQVKIDKNRFKLVFKFEIRSFWRSKGLSGLMS